MSMPLSRFWRVKSSFSRLLSSSFKSFTRWLSEAWTPPCKEEDADDGVLQPPNDTRLVLLLLVPPRDTRRRPPREWVSRPSDAASVCRRCCSPVKPECCLSLSRLNRLSSLLKSLVNSSSATSSSRTGEHGWPGFTLRLSTRGLNETPGLAVAALLGVDTCGFTVFQAASSGSGVPSLVADAALGEDFLVCTGVLTSGVLFAVPRSFSFIIVFLSSDVMLHEPQFCSPLTK
mmetsp:Transcript_12330/g.23954  ORF Transcript_12330/g.23954 Transcript_12330/m.23954 type:complete len:231 (-) Transcript_12330:588-1280(-)